MLMMFIFTFTGNIYIKEEGEIEKKMCHSIPRSDGLIYEGQLVTQDGRL